MHLQSLCCAHVANKFSIPIEAKLRVLSLACPLLLLVWPLLIVLRMSMVEFTSLVCCVEVLNVNKKMGS